MSVLSKTVGNLKRKALRFSTARIVCSNFILFIVIGAISFYITEKNISLIDSLFLSTSAICLTGLTPIKISVLSYSSKVILLILIQLGGLSIVLISSAIGLMVILGLSRSTKVTELMSTVIDSPEPHIKFNKIEEFKKYFYQIFRSILKITFVIEILGAFFIFYNLPTNLQALSNYDKIFISLFTSVSAFNNAGFSLTDDLSIFQSNNYILIIISFLIVLGGIGFPVILFVEKSFLKLINNIAKKIEVKTENYLMETSLRIKRKNLINYFYYKKLIPSISKGAYIISFKIENGVLNYIQRLKGETNQIQTKIIIYGSLCLILFGGILICLLEYNNPQTIGPLTLKEKLINSFFLSISTRTAGFNTFDITKIYESSSLLICYLMLIGGGPQGTAGGLKVTAFIIVIFYVRNILSPNNLVTIYKQKISKNSVAIAIRTVFIFLTFIAIILLFMLILNPSQNLRNIIFEVISAFANVGLSMGLAAESNTFNKLIYIGLMYVGRVSIFLVIIAITGTGIGKFIKQSGDEDGYKIQT